MEESKGKEEQIEEPKDSPDAKKNFVPRAASRTLRKTFSIGGFRTKITDNTETTTERSSNWRSNSVDATIQSSTNISAIPVTNIPEPNPIKEFVKLIRTETSKREKIRTQAETVADKLLRTKKVKIKKKRFFDFDF